MPGIALRRSQLYLFRLLSVDYALTDSVYDDRLHAAHETFNGDDHKQKAHKAHHDVVARLAEHAHKARGRAQDKVCKHVDKHYRAYQYALHRYCMGVAHQHDGVWLWRPDRRA